MHWKELSKDKFVAGIVALAIWFFTLFPYFVNLGDYSYKHLVDGAFGLALVIISPIFSLIMGIQLVFDRKSSKGIILAGVALIVCLFTLILYAGIF
ncbi:MAG: hypothetical protein ABIG39_00665 [Candidatus Micrarchaeota archaeon]